MPANAQKAIDFTLRDLDGNSTKLSDYYHKNVLLLSFWATWCIPCRKELPHLQKLDEKYREEGLKIFAISVDSPESLALVKTFVNRYKYSFPVLLDTESRVVALYNPRVVVPYTILIDKEANITYFHQGYSPGDENDLEEKLVELLESKEIGEQKKFSYHINEAFLNRNFSDKDYVNREREGRKSQIINQLDLSLVRDDFLIGIRFDSNIDFSPSEENFSLAKRFFEVDKGNINLRLGDFYYLSERGLLLSVLKTFEEEGLEYIIDTTIDGGKLSLSRDSIQADVFGGWIDRENSDLKDKVFGSSLGWRFRNSANLCFHYLYSRLEEGSAFGNKRVNMESVSLDLPKISDSVKLHGEFSLIQKNTFYQEERIHGHGLYVETGIFLGNVSLLLEFKDYKNLDFEYNRPPLLENEQLDILASQFDTEATDITGISVRMDCYNLRISSLFYGKFLYVEDSPENHPIFGMYKRNITHFFGGIEKKFKNTGYLNFLFGIREENSSSLFFLSANGNTYHYQFNVSFPFTPRLSLEVDWKSKDSKGEFLEFYERRTALSLHHSPRWIITLFFDRTNEPEILLIKDRKNWWAGQMELRISHANSLRIFYGSTKGSVRCSGGVCKFFPPFEGLRMEVVWMF